MTEISIISPRVGNFLSEITDFQHIRIIFLIFILEERDEREKLY